VVILGKRLINYQALISGIPTHSAPSDAKQEPSRDTGIEHTDH
jgi:hypothetical protein